MNLLASDAISVSRIELGDGLWVHPQSGWEEEISEIHLQSLTGEDELETPLRAENCGGGNDVFADAFGFDIDDTFPGVPSLFSADDEMDLQDLFDGIDVEAETSSPPLHYFEKDAKAVSLIEPSTLQLLTDYGNDVMLDTVIRSLWNPDSEEEVCVTAVDDEEQCESSPVESDSYEDYSPSHLGSPKCRRRSYFESSADENSADDEDWVATRKRKRNGKRSSVNELRRKSTRVDPKSRKKEQNRNAATRYREKKKVMEQEMQADIDVLEIRNKELRKEIQDKEQEVSVIRQLLVAILRPSS